jgi:dTDP-glucose pyrophosphorylase
MWGIIPAAGVGSRIQPLAFSKELLPVGSSVDHSGIERPKAVSEYLVERMILAGVTRICFVIGPGKSDIVEYFGAHVRDTPVCYVVQPTPAGVCDAIFRALPLIADQDNVVVGLPDTIWFPENGLCKLPSDVLSFLCFAVQRPESFEAVVLDATGAVVEIEVKSASARSNWIWGAFRLPGRVLRELHALWLTRERSDKFLGTLVNAWLARGGRAAGSRCGTNYVDVGTPSGYREALALLSGRS